MSNGDGPPKRRLTPTSEETPEFKEQIKELAEDDPELADAIQESVDRLKRDPGLAFPQPIEPGEYCMSTFPGTTNILIQMSAVNVEHRGSPRGRLHVSFERLVRVGE